MRSALTSSTRSCFCSRAARAAAAAARPPLPPDATQQHNRCRCVRGNGAVRKGRSLGARAAAAAHTRVEVSRVFGRFRGPGRVRHHDVHERRPLGRASSIGMYTRCAPGAALQCVRVPAELRMSTEPGRLAQPKAADASPASIAVQGVQNTPETCSVSGRLVLGRQYNGGACR